MINLAEQFTATFKLGECEDFIDPTNLQYFYLFTEAGNIRPIVHIGFTVEDPNIVKFINAGNILTITFGKDNLQTNPIEFELFGDNTNVLKSVGYTVNLKGAFYAPNFTSLTKCKIFSKLSSLDVVKEIAEKSAKLDFKTNIAKTNDIQTWYQNGETDWNFITDPWLHSFINEDTFVAFGFDCFNMYFYDINQKVRGDNDWIFTTNGLGGNIINYNHYITKNNYGTLMELAGKNLINSTFNIDTGEIKNDTYKLKNFTVISSDKLNINANNCESYNYNFINNDCHSNYIKAYNQNLRNNIMYSTFNIFLSTAGNYYPFKLFDTCTIISPDMDTRVEGKSFITGITYQYEDGRLLTNLTLNKEAPSSMIGSDLIE